MKKLFLNSVLTRLAGVVIAGLAFASAAQAATAIFDEQTITYTGTGATATHVGLDLVLRFPANGSLTLPTAFDARILAVGGGGAGGNPRGTNNTAGGGGGAGEMVDLSGVSLVGGTYTIQVGEGGTYTRNNVNAIGGSGGPSYIRGNCKTVDATPPSRR